MPARPIKLGHPGLHSIHWKVFAFHLAVLVLPVSYLAWELRQSLERTHLQATEEGMIDTAALAGDLYARLAADTGGDPAQTTASLSRYFADFESDHSAKSRLFGFTPEEADTRLVFYDRTGRVLYDTLDHAGTGRDHSNDLDVRLALAGRYGSRWQLDRRRSRVLIYSTVPVWQRSTLIGAVSVLKPTTRLAHFVIHTLKELLLPLAAATALAAALAYVLSGYLTRIVRSLAMQAERIAARFAEEQREALTFLKNGIATRNAAFNRMIEEIEHVAVASREPMLFMGPTGAGKSSLARKVFELKRGRHQLAGQFVEVNCATLRGDTAASTLFGHVRGAFTGAQRDRPGLLRSADGGLLFLDEIGELGADEQAMLLRALEEKRFLPVGADQEAKSDFQLIAGTNCDLSGAVTKGDFRVDLMARINLWTFVLPGLARRTEDIAPNLDHELENAARRLGRRVGMAKDVRAAFLDFARSGEAKWSANFRDLNAAVTRMATLAPGGRITHEVLDGELSRLRTGWKTTEQVVGENGDETALLNSTLGTEGAATLDLFDRAQLACVIRVCRDSKTLSEAGKRLFAVTRGKRQVTNDADRLRKYLARFDLSWPCRHRSLS